MRDLIRKDQDRLSKITQMQKMVDEGLKSGVVTDTMSGILADAQQQHRAQSE